MGQTLGLAQRDLPNLQCRAGQYSFTSVNDHSFMAVIVLSEADNPAVAAPKEGG
ncbi:hypothetical protein KJ782_03340 [Patescibacteria group bacterium]|nr:hypothetical protein [Patescibacteria group bacterium]